MILIELNNQEFELRYDFNAICAIEEKAGKPIQAFLNEDSIGFNTIRIMIWAGIRHINKMLSIDMVGEWLYKEITKGKTFECFGELVMKSLKESGILGDKKNNMGE